MIPAALFLRQRAVNCRHVVRWLSSNVRGNFQLPVQTTGPSYSCSCSTFVVIASYMKLQLNVNVQRCKEDHLACR